MNIRVDEDVAGPTRRRQSNRPAASSRHGTRDRHGPRIRDGHISASFVDLCDIERNTVRQADVARCCVRCIERCHLIRSIQSGSRRRVCCEQATRDETAAHFADGFPSIHIDVAAGANVTSVDRDIFASTERQLAGGAFNVRVDHDVAGYTRRCQVDRPAAASCDACADRFRPA